MEEVKYILKMYPENLRKRTHLRDLDVEGKVIIVDNRNIVRPECIGFGTAY
jgi:hypothetical protein